MPDENSAFVAAPDASSRGSVAEKRSVWRIFGVFAKPFPYAIYFRTYQDWVVVTLLWHTARNSEDLRTTLTERDPGDQ